MNRSIALLVLVLLVPLFLFGGTVGKISGKVVDKATGKPLVGAQIMIKGTTLGAAAGEDGRYFILDVPPGIYEVEAQYIGYTKMTVKNVRVTVDLTTTVDFALEVEVIKGQEVTVVAKRPIIEKSATNERRVVRSEDIENMPVRGFTDIAALQTGVVKVGNDLHVRGGRTEEVAFYIDGVYQVNAYDLSQAGDISDNALEEVSYQAGGFDAEYGSANAGIISISTKTGGERLRIAGEAITDEFLSETDPILNTYSYGYNIYNLSVGGPLSKNIRYYLNAERRFLRDRRTSAGPHPVGKWLGDLNENGIKDYEEFEWKSSEGPLPNNSSSQWLFAGNLLLDFKPLKIKLGGNYTYNKERQYVHTYSVFNSENNPKQINKTYSLYARATYTLNPTTLLHFQGSYFFDGYERGSHKFWDDFMAYGIKEIPLDLYERYYGKADTSKLNYDPATGMIIMQPYLAQNGTNPTVKNNYARFYPPHTVYDDYSKNETSYIGFNGDLKTQIGSHEVKIGGEFRQNTIRYYRIATPMRLASIYINNPPYTENEFNSIKENPNDPGYPLVKDYETYKDYIDAYWFTAYKNAYAENMGFTIDGKDYVNDKLEDNRDAPRRPMIAGMFIQDKIELEDLILNLGLRYDYIAPNNLKFRDPRNIVIDDKGQIAERVYKDESGVYSSYLPTYTLEGTPIDTVGTYQLVDAKIHKILSPRIGLAFPVTDRTVFHAQYGKYVQQPELNRMFVSYIRFAANLEQGNFTISGNPGLEPVKTTSYEIGFKQQIGGNASIDMTMFYKQLTGYVQVRNVTNASPVVYATYVNGDYGTVKGFSFSFNLRRTRYVQAVANYTLQWAKGTGSTANGQYRIAWQGGNYPTYVTPLDYDQRHTGSVNIDFRTTERDPIGKAGLNLLLTFGSGRRYTPTAVNSTVFPAISDRPTAALNSGTMPWFFQVDLKIDKTFRIGPTEFDVYLWVQNLLDRDNVRNVYRGTGLPDYDGWFSTEEGRKWAENPVNHADLYDMRQNTPFNYETPRTVRLGIKFNL